MYYAPTSTGPDRLVEENVGGTVAAPPQDNGEVGMGRCGEERGTESVMGGDCGGQVLLGVVGVDQRSQLANGCGVRGVLARGAALP